MGVGSSRPQDHVFSNSNPVAFSSELTQSLESNPESDTKRASELELHIQRRVAAELRRQEAQVSASLRQIEDKISDDTATASKQKSTGPISTSNQLRKSSTSGTDATSLAASQAEKLDNLSRSKVQTEIDSLKSKLQSRKLRDDVLEDKGVEGTRDAVVQCLRVNDRRPLDCWEEVEAFKNEVGRLEKAWVERVGN